MRASGTYRRGWRSGEEKHTGGTACAEDGTGKSEVKKKIKQQENS